MSIERLARNEAAALFVERAVATSPSFTLTEKTARAVAQICVRLDGLPLALELAAARVRVLHPEQIATRLHDHFRLLSGGLRTAPARQQTLQTALHWSFGLLSEQERKLFGGWRFSPVGGRWRLRTRPRGPSKRAFGLLAQAGFRQSEVHKLHSPRDYIAGYKRA